MQDLKILLVDDDMVDRAVVTRTLRKIFPKVSITEAVGIQSAKPFLQERFDCVILDYLLPDGGGIDLIKEFPKCPSPIILLTGIDNDEVGVSALQAGAEDYLIKGEITASSLKRSIRYAMERYVRHIEFEALARQLQESNAKLSALVVTDGLTGIPNRRAFHERLNQLIPETKRGRKFALILADVDHFKKLNDSYGHQVGDEVLISLAKKLSETARETDFVARFGGEEFCILVTDVDEGGAVRQAKRMRDAIRTLSNPHYKLTMSFGVCMYHPSLGDVDSLLRAADAALYHAKNKGRDRVVSFKEIRSQTDLKDFSLIRA